MVIGDVFGISESLATQTCNHAVRELVGNLLNEYVKQSKNGLTRLKASLKTMNFCVLELGTVFLFMHAEN